MLGKKYTTILTKIDSKKNINYLYDIKHGLSIYALEEIIGKIESDKWNFLNMIILHNENKNVAISFTAENKIFGITWFFDLRD